MVLEGRDAASMLLRKQYAVRLVQVELTRSKISVYAAMRVGQG